MSKGFEGIEAHSQWGAKKNTQHKRGLFKRVKVDSARRHGNYRAVDDVSPGGKRSRSAG